MPVLLQILVVASSAGGAERVKFSKIERLSTGNLKIVTTPPEAVVLIDENRLTAKTPLAIKEITPKIRFSLKLSKDGFQPWEHDLVLAPGETKMLRVILKRPYGILKINTVPWSNVYVDGNKAGETPLLLKDLEKGPHQLSLENEQCGICGRIAIDIPGERENKVFRRFHGRLRISSPRGCEIFLDGHKVDFITFHEVLLLAGIHTLRFIQPDGSREKTILIFIEPGKTTDVFVKF